MWSSFSCLASVALRLPLLSASGMCAWRSTACATWGHSLPPAIAWAAVGNGRAGPCSHPADKGSSIAFAALRLFPLHRAGWHFPKRNRAGWGVGCGGPGAQLQGCCTGPPRWQPGESRRSEWKILRNGKSGTCYFTRDNEYPFFAPVYL